MNIIEKAQYIMKHYICDSCLGRQFAQLLSGYENAHRGRVIRSIMAMGIDKESININEMKIDVLNFTGYKFHFLDLELQKIKDNIDKRKCYVCGDIFKHLEKYIDIIEKSLRKIEFSTFLIGTKLSHELSTKEEHLWENVGIDYCEPIKAEFNRELGKLLEKKIRKKFSVKKPDITILLNIENSSADVQINPIFVYGEYQKLIRGIPQTRWPDKKYKTSVEEIIAKPYMKTLSAKGHKLHGYGREDIDARCLGWRPFVLEMLEPKKRIDRKTLLKLAKNIGNHVKVRNLRFSSIAEVRKIKESKGDKTYRAIVVCENPVEKKDLKKLKQLVGEINQRTPERVLHRRANLMRKRKVVSISGKKINNRTLEVVVRGEGGLYIKELISGDNGRTVPSISSILENKCKCKQLDVINIHLKNRFL